MNETPDKEHSVEDGALTPKGQRKFSNLMIGGVVVLILAVLIFVVVSVFLNGA
jgi:hypothetical protein